MRKDWPEAERRSGIVEGFPDSKYAPEAVYWRGVSHYKATSDHTALGDVANILTDKYQDSIWAQKSIP